MHHIRNSALHLPGKVLSVDTNSGSFGTIIRLLAPGKVACFLGLDSNCGSLNDVFSYSHMKNGLKFYSMTFLSTSHDSSFNNNSIQQITYYILDK